MEVLSIKKYNAKQILVWEKRYKEVLAAVNRGERHPTELPQLAMFIFNKNYGYVAFGNGKALWDKSKKGVIAWWEDEERKFKIRGW